MLHWQGLTALLAGDCIKLDSQSLVLVQASTADPTFHAPAAWRGTLSTCRAAVGAGDDSSTGCLPRAAACMHSSATCLPPPTFAIPHWHVSTAHDSNGVLRLKKEKTKKVYAFRHHNGSLCTHRQPETAAPKAATRNRDPIPKPFYT